MTTSFEARLRYELMTAPVAATRPRRAIAGGATALIAAAVGAVVLLLPSPSGAEVEVTHDGGRVIVSIADLEATPEDVQEAIAATGLDVRVGSARVGPSNVGRFMGEEATGPAATDLQRIGESGATFTGFSLPEGWTGTLTIRLGEAAQGDEPYDIVSDAYAPGEPLACSHTIGRTLTDAASVLAGYEVLVRGPVGSGQMARSLEEALAEPGELNIEGAYAVSARQLLVTATPDPVAEADPGC